MPHKKYSKVLLKMDKWHSEKMLEDQQLSNRVLNSGLVGMKSEDIDLSAELHTSVDSSHLGSSATFCKFNSVF